MVPKKMHKDTLITSTSRKKKQRNRLIALMATNLFANGKERFNFQLIRCFIRGLLKTKTRCQDSQSPKLTNRETEAQTKEATRN